MVTARENTRMILQDRGSRGFCAGLLLLALALSAEAGAEEALEEIIVTAQKREQSLQDVPLAVTAITGESLRERAIGNGRELLDSIPGLTVGGTGFGKVEYSLRGVGVDDFQSSAGNAMAIYQDGVVFGSTFGTSGALFDLDQVEVLRGPQGTLWGKNTTAGVINYVTAKPVVGGDVEGFLNASAAEYGQYDIEGAVGFSISETAAVRISGTYQTLDGYFENVNPDTQGDNDTGGYDWLALRAQLAWEPSDRLSARLALSYSDLDGEDAVHKALGLGAFPFDFGFSCSDPAIGTLGTSCVNLLGGVATDDAYETQQAHDGFQKMELFQSALFLDYEFDNAALSVVLAHQTNQRQFFNESDGAAQGVLSAHFDDEHEQFSLEARLSSTGSGPWDWVIGAYYYEDELEYFRSNYILAFGGTSAGRFNRIEAQNIALFGEVGYEFSDKLKVIAGLRLTRDEREGAIIAGSIIPDPTLGDTHLDRETWFGLPGNSIVSDLSGQDESWTEPSARLSIQYAATEDVNLWFTASRGFRGGDFNGGALLEDEFEVTDPEFITNYELGIKGQYLDKALTLNASVFYYEYDDKIGFVEIPGARGELGSISLLANFGDVEGKGGEVELDWQITGGLNVRSSLAYVDAEFVSTNFGLGFGGGDITGNQPAKTPELSWNTFVTYTRGISGGGALQFMLNANWQDDQFFTDVNRGYEAQDAFWLLNASVGYTSPDDTWSARLWGKNLGDEEWFADGFTFIAEHLALPGGPPRQIGGTVTYRF